MIFITKKIREKLTFQINHAGRSTAIIIASDMIYRRKRNK